MRDGFDALQITSFAKRSVDHPFTRRSFDTNARQFRPCNLNRIVAARNYEYTPKAMSGQNSLQNASTKRSQTTPAVMRTHGQIPTSSKQALDDARTDAEDSRDFDAVKWELENVHE